MTTFPENALEFPPAPIALVKVIPDAFLRMAEAGAFAEIEGRVELDRGADRYGAA